MRNAWAHRGLWIVSVLFLAMWMYSAVKPRTFPPDASAYFTEEFLEKSSARTRLAYINSGLSSLASLAALYLIARRSSRSPLIAGFFGGMASPGRAALLGLLLGAGAALVFAMVSLPFSIYGFYVDRRFGLTAMRLPVWLWDYVKSFFLSAALYSAAGSFIGWAAARFPRTWHLALGGTFVVVSLAMNALYPVLIAPMFNTFHPLPEGPIMQDVRQLASAAGMEVDQVLVMEASAKTVRANAYFAGIGRTKQVVLYDNLLTGHTRQEVRLVVAHELGHWRYGHIVKSVLLSAAGTMAALWVLKRFLWGSPTTSLLEIERLLVTLFTFATLAGYVFSPAYSYISRRFERQSDAYSLALAGDRQAFVGSQIGLVRVNLGDIDPPRFIYWFASTHPSTMERIRSASR